MFSIYLLAPFNISFITDDSCFHTGIQQLTKPIVVSAVPQDVKRISTLSKVVRFTNIFLFKEQLKVLLRKTKDSLAHDFSLFELPEKRCLNLLRLLVI